MAHASNVTAAAGWMTIARRCAQNATVQALRKTESERTGLMPRLIDEIHEKLRRDDTLTAGEALLYAQHHIRFERETCAKLAEEWGQRNPCLTDNAFVAGVDHGEQFVSREIARAIRNRTC